MPKVIIANFIGKKYGRLTILSEAQTKILKTRVVAKCECGNIKEYFHACLVQGHTKSCGCLGKELTSKRFKKHGLTNHPLRSIRCNMIKRCYNPRVAQYSNYGGRGITVCNEWLNSFLAFYNWALANGWQKGLEMDRKENNGNYEPSNCRFVTSVVNANNKRNNIYVNYKGGKMAVQFILKANNIKSNAFYARIKRGWPIERAMTEKVLSL